MLSEILQKCLASPPESERRTILYLCGLAGSGKTTTAEYLREHFSATILAEFGEPMPQSVLDTRVESPEKSKLEAQKWILAQYREKNAALRFLTGLIVVDRSWPDAIMYSGIYGQQVLDVIARQAERVSWQLGFTIIFHARVDVVRDRLMEKFRLTPKIWKESWEPYVTHLRQEAIKFAEENHLPSLDTSDLTPQEVAQRAVTILEEQVIKANQTHELRSLKKR